MTKRVLNIDDDEITLTIGNIIMREASFAEHIDTATNGKKALDYFAKIKNKEEVPDFVFLDLNMPVLDGWQFLEEFEKKYSDHFPDLYIAVLSSSIDPREFERAKEHKLIKKFIQKPISLEVLNEIKKEQKNAA